MTTILSANFPALRGTLLPNAPLAPQSWLGVGGAAELLFKPVDADDLAVFLTALPPDVPLTTIGVASNLLIRDGGIAGVVIKLPPNFGRIVCEGQRVTAGAAALDMKVAQAAAQAGIAGLEFMAGIPGTIGGGMRTNAGAYGREFKDVLHSVTLLDRQGQRHVLSAAECGFSYRHSTILADWVVIEAVFVGEADDKAAITQRIQEIQHKRANTQPIKEKTGGSTFANPTPEQGANLPPDRQKAWQLIDGAGCRGLRHSGAMMSEQHCNFMINSGTATATDLETLGEMVRERVQDKYGVVLRWEIVRVGNILLEK